LVELLVVIAIIAILAALLLPALSRASMRAKQTWCASNLRQIGIGLVNFSDDHRGQYPWTVSSQDGGSAESNRGGWIHAGVFLRNPGSFIAMSNELVTARILACPGTRSLPVSRWDRLTPANLNYAVNLQARNGDPDSALVVDDNLSAPPVPALQAPRGMTNEFLSWTPERHGDRGTALFGDSHVEFRRNIRVPTAPPVPAPGPGRPTRPGTGGSTAFPGFTTPGAPAAAPVPAAPSTPRAQSFGGGPGTASPPPPGAVRLAPMTAAPMAHPGSSFPPKAGPVAPIAAELPPREPGLKKAVTRFPPSQAEPKAAMAADGPVFTESEEAIRRTFFWLWVAMVVLGLLVAADSIRRERNKAVERARAEAEHAALLAHEARHDTGFAMPTIAGPAT